MRCDNHTAAIEREGTLMLLRIGQPAGQPTLFAPVGEEAHH